MIMQNLVRSKTIGVTGNGGRGTAGAGPGRDPLYGSRGLPAPYRHTGDLGPHEPCPRVPRVQIVESVESTPDLEAREQRGCSGRRALVGHGLDMGDLASMCEGQCRKACNLPLRCGGVRGDLQKRQGPALPEARVLKTRGGSQGDGDGSQHGQAVVSCRFRGAVRIRWKAR